MVVESLADVIIEVGGVALWLQALGVIVALWIIFEIVSLIVNRKKRKTLYRIEKDLKKIEDKLDKVLKKKK